MSTPLPDTQHQRWLKYGLNVGVTVLIVILLAGAAIYLSQKHKKRFDRTSAGINSLKPQTKNILSDLKKPITLVSLYSRNDSKALAADPQWGDRVAQVDDLLDEYKRNSGQVQIELIDPILYPSKVDDLIKQVETKYGGETDRYKTFLAGYPKKFEVINAFAKSEADKVRALPFDQIEKNESSAELGETLTITFLTVQGFPEALDRSKLQVDRLLKQKPPDYKGATEIVNESMTMLTGMLERIIADFKGSVAKPGIPAGIKTYFAESLTRYEGVKKLADEIIAEIGHLGELKLDSLRQSLKAQNAILVMGDNELKVLPQEKVWQKDVDRRAAPGSDPIKPRFAGEQQISTAILSLTSEKKPKVVFIRPGGPPLTQAMFRRRAPFSDVADRLRDYNFTVLEKDYTNMWQMQAQMQQMPVPPEPTDEDIKDAIWIVVNFPAQPSPMGMPPPSLAPKLKEHLDNGGSAMVMCDMRADTLEAALSEWGVAIKTEKIIIKQAIKDDSGREGDQIEQAERRQQPVFIMKEYGDHVLTRPINSLDGVMIPLLPVQVTKKEGYSATMLLPAPKQPPSFAVSVEALQTESEVTLDPARGDLSPPLYGGAAVEKKDGGRLVVIGNADFASNNLVQFRDESLARQGYAVPRFPGNAELFANSVYWLAKMEPMIAISPTSSQVERIATMSDSVNRAWNVGVLLVLLPGLVVAAGLAMWFARRD
jgi:hypothetical protein